MVNFEDGTLIKNAYVVIDGKEQPVIMPKYSGKTPMSSENLNKVQNDLLEEIQKVDSKIVYSTEEQVVGTWIDGKPLYRKTIKITDTTSNAWTEFSHNISDIDIVTHFYGIYVRKKDNVFYNVPDSQGTYIEMSFSRTNCLYYTSPAYLTGTFYINVEYTKTTD